MKTDNGLDLTVKKKYKFPVLPTYAVIIYIFLYAPLLVVLLYSFNNSTTAFNISDLTLKWYGQVINNNQIFTALLNSLTVSGIAVATACVLGTSGAIFLNRVKFPGQNLFKSIANLPIILPGIILGISILLVLASLQIKLSIWTILIGHITFTTAVVMFQVLARLQRLSPNLEKAATDLGATPMKAFWYVTMPMIKRAVIGGALLAFTMSFDEIVMTFFLAGTQQTLPLYIYGSIRFGISPEIFALSALILCFSVVLIILMAKYTGTEDDKLIQ
jgi:ABC-type spermidine/putrescine transport system, permease component II